MLSTKLFILLIFLIAIITYILPLSVLDYIAYEDSEFIYDMHTDYPPSYATVSTSGHYSVAIGSDIKTTTR